MLISSKYISYGDQWWSGPDGAAIFWSTKLHLEFPTFDFEFLSLGGVGFDPVRALSEVPYRILGRSADGIILHFSFEHFSKPKFNVSLLALKQLISLLSSKSSAKIALFNLPEIFASNELELLENIQTINNEITRLEELGIQVIDINKQTRYFVEQHAETEGQQISLFENASLSIAGKMLYAQIAGETLDWN